MESALECPMAADRALEPGASTTGGALVRTSVEHGLDAAAPAVENGEQRNGLHNGPAVGVAHRGRDNRDGPVGAGRRPAWSPAPTSRSTVRERRDSTGVLRARGATRTGSSFLLPRRGGRRRRRHEHRTRGSAAARRLWRGRPGLRAPSSGPRRGRFPGRSTRRSDRSCSSVLAPSEAEQLTSDSRSSGRMRTRAGEPIRSRDNQQRSCGDRSGPSGCVRRSPLHPRRSHPCIAGDGDERRPVGDRLVPRGAERTSPHRTSDTWPVRWCRADGGRRREPTRAAPDPRPGRRPDAKRLGVTIDPGTWINGSRSSRTGQLRSRPIAMTAPPRTGGRSRRLRHTVASTDASLLIRSAPVHSEHQPGGGGDTSPPHDSREQPP